jgi:class 3 adenylate cyclase
VEYWLESNGAKNISIQIDEQAIQVTALPADKSTESGNDMTLTITNSASYEQRFYVEQAKWYTDAVTAAEVTAMQHFRDLFSDEVLRPGEEIGIQGMTILFTDLVGSTAMYNKLGDAPSYALVRRQFDFLQRIVRANGGAIVKTIGDAIMAAFADPVNAVGAAWVIQQELGKFNDSQSNEPLTIKLGLHYGPCIAVNLNGRLDYFGTTVNLAARLEGLSKGGDIIISESLWQNPLTQKLLKAKGVEVIPFETTIKGFNDNFLLYRLLL